MSQGQPWIDEITRALWDLKNEAEEHRNPYNRIYEAVGRGTEQQGRALVQAVLDLIVANGGTIGGPKTEEQREAEPLTDRERSETLRLIEALLKSKSLAREIRKRAERLRGKLT